MAENNKDHPKEPAATVLNNGVKPTQTADKIGDIHTAYDGIGETIAHKLLPQNAEPYIRLLRLDRPIGTWLLAFPALWGLALGYHGQLGSDDPIPSPLLLFPLFLLGAFLTRSAGCVFNDIADRKIDAQVARTRHRPIASGEITVRAAIITLTILLAAAFAVLITLNTLTIWLGIFILAPILIYPFMKRVTNYPQAMLSLCFSWGALMGWTAVTGSIALPGILVLIAAFAWTMGFDTIYAHQDKEDDAVIGMKSTALTFGKQTHKWLWGFYILTILAMFVAGRLVGAELIFVTFLAIAFLHAGWQITTLKTEEPANCLKRFRANGLFGLFILIGLLGDLAIATLLQDV